VTRFLLAGGSLSALMGTALIFPVVLARSESGAVSPVGIVVIAVACILIACGLTAVVVGIRQGHGSGLPGSVRTAVAANIIFLGFFALESSDRVVRQGGNIVYWSTYLFLPALLLFYGLLTARPWAWWLFRGVAALGTLWFLAFVAMSPFAHLQSHGVPVPWYGRIYVAGVSLVFAGTLAGAFWSLGRPETRSYFRLTRFNGNATA
jgi:hypothetical protein